MKINLINNIRFAYNKDYHDKLHQKLARQKNDLPLAQQLSAADEFCLSLEDKINEIESDGSDLDGYTFNELTNFLIELRLVVADYFSANFNNFHYPQELIKQYTKEAKNAANDVAKQWRLDLCDSLSGLLAPVSNNSEDNMETFSSMDNSVGYNIPIGNLKKPDFLDEFIPRQSSPKGFCDVVGFENQKNELKESIIEHIDNPELAEIDKNEYGITLPRGYLFYGPPGCGKTFLTEAIAAETGLKMYKMDLSKIGSSYVNQTAKNIQGAFDFLKAQAQKDNKPVLLFIDEVDSLVRKRQSDEQSAEDSKTTTTLLKLIHEARDNGIIVIAATNRYDILDEAFTSRFDNQQYFGLPDMEQIQALLKKSLEKRLKGQELARNNEAIKNLAIQLKDYSNRSITFIVDEAAKIAKRKGRLNITSSDVAEAINKCNFDKVDESSYRKDKRKTFKLGFN